jgi:UDP-glucose 4-epimerase
LGNGSGYSVLEVIDVAELVTGRKISIVRSARRSGDPAFLVADSSHAKKELGWRPIYADLPTIVKHAWNWECKR